MAKTWFTIKQLHPNIWGIAEFGHEEKVISYLFVGQKESLLFDTGLGIGNIHTEVLSLTKLPVTVVNSHSHYDHIGGNSLFMKHAAFVNSFSLNRALKGYSTIELNDVVRRSNFSVTPPKTFRRKTFRVKPYNIDHQLIDGELLHIEPFIFRVIHTPGHTPDSICLYEEKTKILLTGDTLYDGPIYLFFEESNKVEYKKSIVKLHTIKDISNILPSHNSFNLPLIKLRKMKNCLENLDLTNNSDVTVSGKMKLLFSLNRNT